MSLDCRRKPEYPVSGVFLGLHDYSLMLSLGPSQNSCICPEGNDDDVLRQLRCILGLTQHGCALAGVLKKCLSGDILGSACSFRDNLRTESASRVAGLQDDAAGPPSSITQSPGERSRRFPCKHAPVQLAFDGFDLLYRLWTLPYSFLTRIICDTVSVIVRRRRASSPSRVDNPAASRALMKMDSDLLHSPAVGLTEEEEADMNDWKLPLTFMKKRHLEKIEGSKALAQSWRMKDRVNGLLVYVCITPPGPERLS
ncbi:hypothetical protein AMECASPLE_025112 [Ameca splendens]|uniref:Uncharacterized protein n=1 Tax=Ameca splendens TaxID=208324 RepID=A0ABV0XHM4_9TELE